MNSLKFRHYACLLFLLAILTGCAKISMVQLVLMPENGIKPDSETFAALKNQLEKRLSDEGFQDAKVSMDETGDKVLFQLNRGNGIGRYVNDLNSIGNYDGIFDESTGNLQLFNVFAGYGSLQHWWDDSMRSNFTFGWVEINNPGFIDGEAYKRTLRASANIIWNPTEQVDTGLEYLWGRRQNKSGDYGDAQQLQMMIRYIF